VTESPPDNALEVRGLTKTYAGSRKSPPKTALKGVDLVVPRGSIFGLLGPNGAGKSTLINILAGVVNKSGGQALIWGRDIDEDPRGARAALGVVAQEITADVFFTHENRSRSRRATMAYPPVSAAPTNSWRRWAFPTRPMPMCDPCRAA